MNRVRSEEAALSRSPERRGKPRPFWAGLAPAAPRGVGPHGVGDGGEWHGRVLARGRGDVGGEDEADPDHKVPALGGKQAQTRLTIAAFAGFNKSHPGTQVVLRARAAQVGAIVE